MTIKETIIKADNDATGTGLMGGNIALFHLHVVSDLLKKGYDLNDEVDILIEKYKKLDLIPCKNDC